eukprot:TRINITY_DN22779_c0_g1_i1.p1 TRINITY_DN22779_c0_g1~~TRINITY_DN22779_c0_g1_i1.p1  ORF type:complete len:780 (-),score=153.53 TRINITY_DN22779_c0_g1_i1:25-2289(-)
MALAVDDLAAVAAAAAKSSGTHRGATIIEQIASLSPELSHGGFRHSLAEAALMGLNVLDQQAQSCIKMLVAGVSGGETCAELAFDAVWLISKLPLDCDSTRRWLLDAGSLCAIEHVLASFPDHKELVDCAVWVVKKLSGLNGLWQLLESDLALKTRTAGSEHQPLSLSKTVVASILWSVVKYPNDRSEVHLASSQDMDMLVRLLVGLMKTYGDSAEVLHACVTNVETLVKDNPRLGTVFLKHDGGSLVIHTMHHAVNLGVEEELVQTCANTVATLAKGSAIQGEMLRQLGVEHALVRVVQRGRGGVVEESAIWAIGHVFGLREVVQALENFTTESVVRGCLSVIAELTREAGAEELSVLLGVLKALMTVNMRQYEHDYKMRKMWFKATTSTVCALAPLAKPSQDEVFDQAVFNLISYIRGQLEQPSVENEVLENVVEALGNMALVESEWRKALRQRGIVELLTTTIRGRIGERRLLKYCFWAAAAFSGLPFVVKELEANQISADVADAAFCTIIDILDNDLEGEWVLRKTERCNDAELPKVLNLVAEVMQMHTRNHAVQSRGLHSASLLTVEMPVTVPVPPEVMNVVFASANRHSTNNSVMRSAVGFFRACLEPRASRNADGGAYGLDTRVIEAAVDAMKARNVQTVVEEAVKTFSHHEEPELLEDGVFVLAFIVGFEAALCVLKNMGPGSVRVAGIKALFELGRMQPWRLQGIARDVAVEVAAMADQSREEDKLQQHASLLTGLCHHIATCQS